MNTPPPLSKVICLGWHDGPSSGLALAEGDGRAYRFEMIDGDWDPDGMDVRIFSLAPIVPSAFHRLVEILAPYQSPRWPVFAPLWRFPTEEERDRLDRVVDSILAEAGPPGWLIAAEDLAGERIAFRELVGDDREVVRRRWAENAHADASSGPSRDWFAYLGIEKSPAREPEA